VFFENFSIYIVNISKNNFQNLCYWSNVKGISNLKQHLNLFYIINLLGVMICRFTNLTLMHGQV
jgi:hypothetical protein